MVSLKYQYKNAFARTNYYYAFDQHFPFTEQLHNTFHVLQTHKYTCN